MTVKVDTKAIRTRYGLTQAELARRLKVDVSTVSRWERGEQEPDRRANRRLTRLVKRLEVNNN